MFKQERPDPVQKGKQFIDLDDQVPPPVQPPADEWVEILNDAKDEFEVDGAVAVFSTWRLEVEDQLDIGDIEIADGMHVRASRLALNARMLDKRAAQLLAVLLEDDEHLLMMNTSPRLFDRDWSLEVSQSPRSHCRLQETDRGLVTR